MITKNKIITTILNVVFFTMKREYVRAAAIRNIKSNTLSMITIPSAGATGIFSLLLSKNDLINSPTLPGVKSAHEIPIAWKREASLKLIL